MIPRLVALANARLFGSDLVLEMGLAWVIVAVTALCVHGLLRRWLPGRPGSVLGATFLANLLLFSPLQWENLLWAAQPFFLFPTAALCAALLVLETRWRPGWKFAACAVLALAATHTFAHGIPLWPVLFVAVALGRGVATRRARGVFLAAWALLAVAVLVPYFTVDGMRSTSEASHAFEIAPGERAPDLGSRALFAHPERAVHFFVAMLGNPFARTTVVRPGSLATVCGVALGAAFALVLGYGLLRWRDRGFRERWLPAALLGGYATGLCAVAALGRTASGTKWAYALLPHYVGFSHSLVIATMALALLAVDDLRARLSAAGTDMATDPGLRAVLLGAGPPFAGGLLAVALLLGWLVGAQGMDEWASARLQGRTSLVFLERFPFRFHRRLEGSLEVLQRLSHEMDRYGYLHPPLVHDRGLGGFAIGEPLPAGAGAVEGAVVRRGQVAVRGWAWLPEADRRADGVLFVVEDPSGVPLPVGLAELHGMLRFVVPAVDHAWDEVRVPGPADFGHWSGSLRTAELPAGDTLSVGAFAVDGRARVLHRLAQELVVRRGAGRLAVEIREAGP